MARCGTDLQFNTVFRNLFFLPTANPTLTMARGDTPQNFALRKWVQNNTWPHVFDEAFKCDDGARF
jgi:hypothetical protein